MSDWTEMAAADVLTLGMQADDVRRRSMPSAGVTYLRVHTVTAEAATAQAAVPAAAAEVRLHEAPETIDEAVATIRALRKLAGERRLAAFSMADLVARGWATEDTLRQLAEAGLQDVAELPVDQLDDVVGAVRLLERAGVQPRRLTVSHPVAGRQMEIIQRAREAFEAAASLRRFAPLPRVAPVDKPTTGYDDVRMVALSRIAMPAVSIEVDWALYGPKLAQVALTFGADHLDSVAALDDDSLGRRRTSVEDVERNIRAAGFEPHEHVPA